jgi:predicted deacylase
LSASTETKIIQIGSAISQPGEISYGWFEGPELPGGFSEKLPVIIAQGRESGPTFWITANIHGDELTGISAIHATITAELAQKLRGTVVAIPSLNPSGLRTSTRSPYYDNGDPNRSFPEYARPDENENEEVPSIYQSFMNNLYQEITRTADYLIDLHCYSHVSTPFSIRDRVLYRHEEDIPEAEDLHARLAEMVKAFGLPVVNEFIGERYVKQKLHRSTSGIALNEKRIPAFTVELGPSDFIDPNALESCKVGIINVLKWAGMLEGEIEQITCVPVPEVSYEVRRENTPKAPESGLVQFRVRPGDLVKKGEIIAVLTDIFGRQTQEIASLHDGWIMSLHSGLVIYKGQTVANTAIRDEDPLVVPFP